MGMKLTLYVYKLGGQEVSNQVFTVGNRLHEGRGQRSFRGRVQKVIQETIGVWDAVGSSTFKRNELWNLEAAPLRG